jgi:hypothetical protein
LTTSSDDDSKEQELPKGAKILDIRDRLPPVISGDNPSGNLAVALLKTIIERDEGKPHIWFAGLMMTSYALQRLLTNGWGVDEEKLRVIFAKAMEIADNTQINIDFKNLKPKDGE